MKRNVVETMARTVQYRTRKVKPLAAEMTRLTLQVRDLEAKRDLVRDQLVALMVKDENIRVGEFSVCKAWMDEYIMPEHERPAGWRISVRKVKVKKGK